MKRWKRFESALVWLAVWSFGVFVGTWWAHNGAEVMARLAAWSERPAAPGSIRPTPEQMKAAQDAWKKRRAE